jgi:L-Ala-D/L-Glu epimerase
MRNATSRLTWTVAIDRFPTDGSFTISRGARREAVVVVASVTDGTSTGRGEATPYARYGETVDGVVAAIEAVARDVSTHVDLGADLGTRVKGAARNAMDCALWDFEAKRTGQPVHILLGLSPPKLLLTAYTLSLDTAAAMAAKALQHSNKPLLKMKLGGPGDVDRLQAVRQARPDARIIVDANEGWSGDALSAMMSAAAAARVELIEQPLPAGEDERLRGLPRPVPLCADESVHTRESLAQLAGLYDAVNIKLDKSGGLTEALALRDAARAAGFKIMVGCMLSSSLAMAPAVLVADGCDWCDLDGPLLLAADRSPAVQYIGALLSPPPRGLWG